MMPSPRPRNTRQALAALQYAFGTVARPNPLVLAWWWRYELGLGIGLPVLLLVLVGVRGMLVTLVTLAVLTGVSMSWAPSRCYLADRAWCVITPHRVRVGCVQGWIHSRRGKIPTVLLTTRQPFGERVHLWCRAGTSIEDFASALPLLVAACWASGIQVTGSQRYTQMIALDVIRRSPDNQVYAGEPVLPPDGIPAPRFPLDDMDDVGDVDDVGDGPQPWPFGPYHKGSWNPFRWPNR